jgi:hypothetical protein
VSWRTLFPVDASRIAASTAIGAVVGAAAGVVFGWTCAVAVLALRRLRNARLAADGEPPYRDLLLPPLHVPGGGAGLLGGAVAGALGSWRWAIVAAAALPALFLLASGVVVLAQSARR